MYLLLCVVAVVAWVSGMGCGSYLRRYLETHDVVGFKDALGCGGRVLWRGCWGWCGVAGSGTDGVCVTWVRGFDNGTGLGSALVTVLWVGMVIVLVLAELEWYWYCGLLW